MTDKPDFDKFFKLVEPPNFKEGACAYDSQTDIWFVFKGGKWVEYTEDDRP